MVCASLLCYMCLLCCVCCVMWEGGAGTVARTVYYSHYSHTESQWTQTGNGDGSNSNHFSSFGPQPASSARFTDGEVAGLGPASWVNRTHRGAWEDAANEPLSETVVLAGIRAGAHSWGGEAASGGAQAGLDVQRPADGGNDPGEARFIW